MTKIQPPTGKSHHSLQPQKLSRRQARKFCLSLLELMDGEKGQEIEERLIALKDICARINERVLKEQNNKLQPVDLPADQSTRFKPAPTQAESLKTIIDPIPMGRKKSLTNSQVLGAVNRLTARFGFSPTLEELRLELKVGSKRTVQRYLLALELDGLIEYRFGTVRGIRVNL